MKTTRIMKKLSFLILILTLGLASCQENKYPDLDDGVYAEFNTNKGVFVAKLHNEETPLTVANFVELAEGKNELVDSAYQGKKYYDGLNFHRIIKGFMIQGGDPLGNGSGNPGYTFPDEFSDSLTHSKKGILSMANSGPGTNGSQFFITLKETPWLDGKHSVFGEIVIGQDIVDSLGVVETSKPGDKPVDPVIINELKIIRVGDVSLLSFNEAMTAAEEKVKEEQAARLVIAATTAEVLASDLEKGKEMPSGIKVYFNKKGSGVKPAQGAKVKMNYAGYLTNGTLFDSNIAEVAKKYNVWDHRRADGGGYAPTETEYSKEAQLIPGFREGLLMMGVGDKITLLIPAHLAYGERGIPNLIPPGSDLIFNLELVEVVK
jgi:cyclophilin family peptidyl-prolyl cis-trans isomerase/FKBP-type peptidyl-prolyl cis-trans isomerase